ncbi:MAG: hypothetical protein K6T55_09610 [Syntrophobacterales bacterium]|nr:hypothetical protein [Syntrophobacterales bacterium]
MRFLDMTPYHPFREMARTCDTRPLRDKRVRWVRPEPRLSRDGRFLARLLRREELDAAAGLWRAAYPELYGSVHDFLLFPEECAARVALEDAWEEDSEGKPCLMLVAAERRSGRLAAATLMTKMDRNLQIEFSFAATHPEFRRQGLMYLLGEMMHHLAEASGAEYLTTFLETWHTITQTSILKYGGGWRVAGIFPGAFTRWAGGQREYRGCVVYLYKFIRDGERYATRPEEWHLHPKLRQLWQVLEEINRDAGETPDRR